MTVSFEERDGTAVVVKTTTYDARTEAVGLDALRAAGAHVPAVVAVAADRLVTERVVGDGDWAGFAERLAAVHATVGHRFGWDVDGAIGPLPLDNTRSNDWPTFWWRRRIAPYLPSLPDALGRRLRDAWEDGRVEGLFAHDPSPSLCHGDLWSGNVVGGQWLVDPAIQHADRELDLAMADLFGGFPPTFWHAYDDVLPRSEGWQHRLPAQQLHHLLVHVELFGASYVPQVADRLSRLGW